MEKSSTNKDFLFQAKLDRYCIDNAGVGIYRIAEEDGKILSVNQQACIDLGYSKEELVGMTVFELDPNFSKKQINKWYEHRKNIRKKGTATIETLHKRKDGSLMPVEVTITYLDFEGHQFSVSFARNITKRKKAEEALFKSEQLFRTTLYSIGDAVMTCDTEGKLVALNAVAEQLTGWKEKEAEGIEVEKVFKIINEDSRQKVESPVDKVLAEGKIVGLANHTLLISKEGHETPIADSGAPIFSDKGSITGVVVVFRDQTEERQHKMELEKSRNYLSTLLNNLPGMAFRCLNTPDWPMAFVSRGCEALTGYTRDELLTRKPVTYGDLIHPRDKEGVWNEVQKNITSGQPYQIEYRLLTRDDKIKWVWEQGEAVFSDDGNIEALEGFITDISERKNYEKKLKENDRLKTAFLQNVSHEIRTPLNSILGFTELIKHDDIPREERNEYIDIVQSSGQKLLGILNNVLELSRIETGDVSIDSSSFPLNELFYNLYTMFHNQAEDKGLELKLNLGGDNTLSFETDYSKLDQIFTNLISNAIKYTEKGTIEFGYSPTEKGILFFVKDTGMGIPKEQQQKVFDRFYRSEDPRMIQHDGAGLGLSICVGLIDLLNGDIWLESEPDVGTTFSFILS